MQLLIKCKGSDSSSSLGPASNPGLLLALGLVLVLALGPGAGSGPSVLFIGARQYYLLERFKGNPSQDPFA